jgi:hypothetical protein
MFKTKSLAPAVAMSFDCKLTTPTVMHSGHRYKAIKWPIGRASALFAECTRSNPRLESTWCCEHMQCLMNSKPGCRKWINFETTIFQQYGLYIRMFGSCFAGIIIAPSDVIGNVKFKLLEIFLRISTVLTKVPVI